MAGVTINIKPEIIDWVLQKLQFENAPGSVIDLLGKWKSGEKSPTFNQVEKISKQINIPFGYFFLSAPPVEKCSLVEYRTMKSTPLVDPSRNLLDTLDLMTEVQGWMTDYVIENGQEELSFVGSAAGNKSIINIANDIRKKLNIFKDWYSASYNAKDSFKFLRNQIEYLGIIIMMSGIVGNNTRRKLNLNEFRAFTLVNKYAPLIFINTCDSETGKLFSLVHELCHVWIGQDSLYNNQMSADAESEIERICNAVAAEILVPEDLFRKQWKEQTAKPKYEMVETLAKCFKCSRYVIARRALDVGFISRATYEEIVAALIKQFEQWKASDSNSGGNYYSTLRTRLDHRFVRALESSAKEGKTQYTEVYRLTNTNRVTFHKLITSIGGAG